MSDGDHVRMMTCRFCGKPTESIALSTRVITGPHEERKLKPLPETVFDNEPCSKCKALFNKGYKFYFSVKCKHQGFISPEGIRELLNPETVMKLEDTQIFEMEKCFQCVAKDRNKTMPS